MIKKTFLGAALAVALSSAAVAQNSNTGAGRGVGHAGGNRAPARTTPTPAPTQTPTPAPARTARRGAASSSSADSPQARAVREAFDSLVDGIRKADAAAVMALYWNSPQLSVFNNNGTVTRGFDQARSNRESLYSKVSDVKLDVRDVRVKTLGPTAALVTCLWEQSQTVGGQPERASGRLTIVYQKVGADWKIVHTHTSPDHPSPSNLLPSERTPEAEPTRPPARP
ncbi:MAG TPA: nuclear transport factor 2 family protein [Pyrinomonadaceae bacterium]|jgi:uncharacterized protein (TIGR02246 family)|nr:nuclear transport factor 2 family protein [Pyrinomonadaceae bacterium]